MRIAALTWCAVRACLATPSAYRWLSEDAGGGIEALEQRTGHPVGYQYKLPSQPDVLPLPNAMLVAPATSNTLNIVIEAIGLQIPVVALPHWNDAQDRQPAIARSVQELRAVAVTVLLGEGGFTPHRRCEWVGWCQRFGCH